MRRFVSTLLCFAILSSMMTVLTSCEKNEEQPEPVIHTPSAVVKDEDGYTILRGGSVDLSGFTDDDSQDTVLSDTYSFTPFSMIPDDISFSGAPYLTRQGDIYLKAHKADDPNVRFLAHFDENGIFLESIPYEAPSDTGEMVKEVRMLDDGSFVYVTVPYRSFGAPDNAVGDIIHVGAQGTVLSRAEIPGNGIGSFSVLSDGRYVVPTQCSSVCFFDEELKLLCEVPVSVQDVLLSPADEIFARTQWVGTYERIHADSMTSREDTVYRPGNVGRDKTLFFSAAASGYDAYCADDTGIWGIKANSSDAVLLCDWLSSGMMRSSYEIIGALDENSILVNRRSSFSDGDVYGLLEKDTDAKTRRMLTLGFVDDPLRVGAVNMENVIREAVSRFNADNKDGYYIRIVDYYSSSPAAPGEIPDTFKDAVLKNQAADLIVSTGSIREPMQVYVKNGAFSDLSGAVKDVLLPCAVSAYEKQGALYMLPTNMMLSTLVTKSYTLSGDETLSVSAIPALSGIAEKEGLTLFNNISAEDVLAAAAPTYADRRNGTCSYNSPEFGDFIRFYETVLNYRAYSADHNLYCFSGMYFVHDQTFLDDLADDQFLILNMPIHTITAYPILKTLYNHRDFSIHGYPANEKEIVLFDSMMDIAVNAGSDKKRGALSFLAYYLSPEIQTAPELNRCSLPVTYDGIESLLEVRDYYFPKGLFQRDPGGDYSISCYNEAFSQDEIETLFPDAEKIHLTKEDIHALRRLFYTSEMQSLTDTAMTAVIDEEVSAYLAGVRSLEEMQKILQSRLYLYLNE